MKDLSFRNVKPFKGQGPGETVIPMFEVENMADLDPDTLKGNYAEGERIPSTQA